VLTASSIWTFCRRNACTRSHPRPPPPSACSNTSDQPTAGNIQGTPKQGDRDEPVRGGELTSWAWRRARAGSCRWDPPRAPLPPAAAAEAEAEAARSWAPRPPGAPVPSGAGAAAPAPATAAWRRSGWPPWEHGGGHGSGWGERGGWLF
jgi:hypothetical protein